jgi:hypothetical protein
MSKKEEKQMILGKGALVDDQKYKLDLNQKRKLTARGESIKVKDELTGKEIKALCTKLKVDVNSLSL